MSSRRLALALLIVTAFAALAIARPQQREAAAEVPPCDPRMERPCFMAEGQP